MFFWKVGFYLDRVLPPETESGLGFNLLSAHGFSSATCLIQHPSGGETKRTQSRKSRAGVEADPGRVAGAHRAPKFLEQKGD